MINLLPADVKEGFYYGRKNSQIIRWIITVLFGIVVLLIVAAVGRLTIQTARNQAVVQKQTIEQQLTNADYQTTDEEYSAFVGGLGNVKKLYQQQILYTRLIRKLGTLLPPGAKLTNIAISDQDRAINLNFNNDADGLGPTIQLNLTDQSQQVADETRRIFDSSLMLSLGGNYAVVNSSKIAEINTDATNKTISYLVNASGKEAEERLNNVAKNNGEMAFAIVSQPLAENSNLTDYRSLSDAKSTDLKNRSSLATQPQIRSYEVDTDLKTVDFVVRADSVEEAKTLEATLVNSPNSLFIESYVFEDMDYKERSKCNDIYLKDATCQTICSAGACKPVPGNCVPAMENGCQYIVRAYYDELYKSMTVKKLDEATQKSCLKDAENKLPCTHSVEATYTQLFNKVDINRVATCTQDQTSSISTCPVEIRAEFSPDAKFYLINPGASK